MTGAKKKISGTLGRALGQESLFRHKTSLTKTQISRLNYLVLFCGMRFFKKKYDPLMQHDFHILMRKQNEKEEVYPSRRV